MSAFPGVWALRLSDSRNGWMESIRIFSAGITVSTLKISGIAAKRSTTSIVNMIWQDWISSFCQRHRAKGSLHMLSVMSSTRCSAIIWPRRHMPTLTRTTRRHPNSAQNWGSSANQGRGFSKRAQRIWRSLGIRSRVPAQQNRPEGSGEAIGPALPPFARHRTRTMKKPTGWGAGGRIVLFVVEVARVELASKYVKYSATTGLVGCCTLRSAGSRRPALHDFPFGTLWQGTGTTLAFETPIDAPLTDPGMDDPERR